MIANLKLKICKQVTHSDLNHINRLLVSFVLYFQLGKEISLLTRINQKVIGPMYFW
jgi:hypothetical protein